MRKLNLHDLYVLGNRLAPLSDLTPETKYSDAMFNLWYARSALTEMVDDTSPLLDAAKRAARNLVSAINRIVPTETPAAFEKDKDAIVGYGVYEIKRKVKELESVLSNEMPSIPAFIVSKKGIYDTDGLISRADNYFPASIRVDMPDQAKKDICEAGKCLAFELPTACSFHLWRAVETTMCAYYATLTGSDVEKDKINRNWGAYIKALEEVGAAKSVTEFLDHIREEYRNPQTHPDQTVDLDEALSLFGAAASSINQIILALQKVRSGRQLALISESPATLADRVASLAAPAS